MNMQNRHIDHLIARHLDGERLSDAEQAELLDWLRSSEEHRRNYLDAYDAWGEEHLTDTCFDAEAAYRRFTERVATPAKLPAPLPLRQNRPLRRRIVGIACAAACSILLVTGFFLRGRAEQQIPDIREFARATEAPAYTEKEVQLVLSEQKTVRLEEKRSSIRYDASEIHINEDAREPITKKEVAAFNQLLVPYGKQTTLTLADGTRVWVNAGSRLIYPSAFDSDSREIYAEGEIYIEVAHDAARPFTLHTGKMDIRVLGTRFYVSSYGRDRAQEVVLRLGSVSVAPTGAPERGIRIEPDQRASLDTAGTFRIRKVRAEDYISWIHGYYRFDNTPLSDVLARLARYYNRTFDCSPEVGVMTISGKLELNDDPGEVLRVLSLTAPIRFRASETGFSLCSAQNARKEHDNNPNRMPMENHDPS